MPTRVRDRCEGNAEGYENPYRCCTPTEKALRDMLKAAGGRWDPAEKLWRVAYGSVRSYAALVERIVKE